MKKRAILSLVSLLFLPLSAQALPSMDLTTAKQALQMQDSRSAAGKKFKSMRVRDLPAFDRIGVGNYFSEYNLDAGQKLMIWMYVESAPPTVDEVVLYIKPSYTVGKKDLKPSRALDLLKIVYQHSAIGNFVVNDFREAVKKPANLKKGSTEYAIPTFEFNSRLPLRFDGSLYYLGPRFGYRVSLHKAGFQVEIKQKEPFVKWLEQKAVKQAPMRVIPTPEPPPPEPTPFPENPDIRW